MNGSCADAGRCGAREVLAKEMHKLGRTFPLDAFLVNSYYYHGFNLMMALPCEKCFGDGGMSNRNLIQLLCTFCAIQKWHKIEEFCEM